MVGFVIPPLPRFFAPIAFGRVPLLGGRCPASSLIRTRLSGSRLRRTSPSGSRGYLASAGFLRGARSPSLFSPMTLSACCCPLPRRVASPQIAFGVACCLRHCLALLIEIRTEPSGARMTDDDARRGMILDVSDRGARKSAVTAAPRVTGEFQSVVLASSAPGAFRFLGIVQTFTRRCGPRPCSPRPAGLCRWASPPGFPMSAPPKLCGFDLLPPQDFHPMVSWVPPGITRLIECIRHFDEACGWYQQGAMSCAHWLAWRVGWDPATARERVRVARALGKLPVMDQALKTGKLSYAKGERCSLPASCAKVRSILGSSASQRWALAMRRHR
jgi:hypothetical protein